MNWPTTMPFVLNCMDVQIQAHIAAKIEGLPNSRKCQLNNINNLFNSPHNILHNIIDIIEGKTKIIFPLFSTDSFNLNELQHYDYASLATK